MKARINETVTAISVLHYILWCEIGVIKDRGGKKVKAYIFVGKLLGVLKKHNEAIFRSFQTPIEKEREHKRFKLVKQQNI
jgi:hypothetical protein